MKRQTWFILTALAVATLSAVLLWVFVVDGPTPEEPAVSSEPDAGSMQQDVRKLTVSVVDHDAEPIAGAAVEAGEGRGTTDAEGRWTSTEVGPGEVSVTATADGYISSGPLAALKKVKVAPGGELAVTLTLRKPGDITGRITAAGQPVEARLSLIYAGDAFAMDGAGRSGPDGEFTLEDVPPGRLRILVETEKEFATEESREIALADGESVTGIEIDLARGGTIAGKVLDADGNPIADAEVIATGERSPRARRARTLDTGGFRIDHFPAGAARVRVSAEGFTEEIVEPVAVEATKVAVVEVTLQRGTGIWGTVHTRDGRPAGAALVVLQASEGKGAVTRTGQGGAFRLEQTPPPGSTVVAVSPYRGRSEIVNARPGARIDLTLGGKGAVRGRVIDADGNPVTEFDIGVESMEVADPVPYRARSIRTEDFASSDGTFEFEPLRPGRYWLRANAQGHAPGSAGPVVVREGAASEELVIRLTSGGTLSGTVTAKNGRPLGRAQVTVFDPGSPFRTARTRTASDGSYKLKGVPPGRRSIRVSRRGYLTSVSSGITIPEAGEATRDVQLGRKKKKNERFSFHGIGAVLEKTEDGSIQIRKTMEGKPAAIFGLKKGDTIMAVDGQSTSDMRLGNVIELIRGEEGVAVELTLQRQGEGRVTVEVERGRVVVK